MAAVFALAASVTGFFGVTSSAHADDASSEAAAQTLFDQARALMNQKDYAHACPKFAASQKEDPAPGTLLDLANCYEKNGQTASAWASYKDAAAAARAAGRKVWERQATASADALAPKLSRVTVRAPLRTPDETFLRDGQKVMAEELDVALPIDPGTHSIDASAPGKTSFHKTVTVELASQATVEIPPLSDASNAPAANSAPPAIAGTTTSTVTRAAPDAEPPLPASGPAADATAPGSGLRTAGVIVGGAGVAGLIVGTIAGLVSLSKNSSAKDVCPNDGLCPSRTAVDDASSARSWGNGATVGFIAGGVLAGGGLTMILLARGSSDASVRPASAAFGPSWQRPMARLTVVPWLTNGKTAAHPGGGLGLQGEWR